MKILLAGNYSYHIYEEAVAEAMEDLGHQVTRFSYNNYVRGFIGKVEGYLSWIGLLSLRMNYNLLKEVTNHQPDILLIWRGTLISPYILKKISKKSPKTKLISFNNDDPFSSIYQKGKIHQRRLWKNFKKTVPCFDINLVYRPHNIEDYNEEGSKKTIIFPPYFIPESIDSVDDTEKIYDVSFTGHHTKEREEVINYLLDNGVKVKIFGIGWNIDNVSQKYSYEKDIEPVYSDDYFKVLKSSKICLAFLSKLNRDVYTRRNFEIPACEILMLSERTKELEEYYEPNAEALFFSSPEEALKIVSTVLKNDELRIKISKQGKERAYQSGYSVKERVREMLTQI